MSSTVELNWAFQELVALQALHSPHSFWLHTGGGGTGSVSVGFCIYHPLQHCPD